jgi:hypothetical protein
MDVRNGAFKKKEAVVVYKVFSAVKIQKCCHVFVQVVIYNLN